MEIKDTDKASLDKPSQGNTNDTTKDNTPINRKRKPRRKKAKKVVTEDVVTVKVFSSEDVGEAAEDDLVAPSEEKDEKKQKNVSLEDLKDKFIKDSKHYIVKDTEFSKGTQFIFTRTGRVGPSLIAAGSIYEVKSVEKYSEAMVHVDGSGPYVVSLVKMRGNGPKIIYLTSLLTSMEKL